MDIFQVPLLGSIPILHKISHLEITTPFFPPELSKNVLFERKASVSKWLKKKKIKS